MAGKNPWLSLWLSAANSWAGKARSFWTAEARRQQSSLLRPTPKPAGTKAGKARPKRSTKAKTGRKTGQR